MIDVLTFLFSWLVAFGWLVARDERAMYAPSANFNPWKGV